MKLEELTQEHINIIRLYRAENVGPNIYKKLLELYTTASDAINALPNHAMRGGMKRQINIPSIAEIEHEVEKTYAHGAVFLFDHEDAYPDNLKEIADAPPFMIAKGNLELLSKRQLGIVGSRNASPQALKLTQDLAIAAGKTSWVITSGLARGIDTAAHYGGLDTGTIAAIAGGIDNIYPPENHRLYHQIYEQGLVITETPIQKAPQARLFPKRNRIISALSKSVLIVEATLKSGSLITANYAMEHGKEILAVPGSPMDPRCSGTNQLIKDGATMVTSAEELVNILSQPDAQKPSQQYFFADTHSAQAEYVYESPEPIDAVELLKKNLSFVPLPLDEVLRGCQISSSDAQSALLELELAGKITRTPGGSISLIEEIA